MKNWVIFCRKLANFFHFELKLIVHANDDGIRFYLYQVSKIFRFSDKLFDLFFAEKNLSMKDKR